MASGMDLVALRQLVGGVLDDFAGLWRHQDISAECGRLPGRRSLPLKARGRSACGLVVASQS